MFALGTISMLVGLVLLVTSVRLSTPSLALFLISGGLIGAGAGAVFKGTTGLVLDGTAPENRVAMTAELLIALFVGLSVPVIGAGVALDQGASAPNTVLGFAILVGLGVAGAGWGLLGHSRQVAGPGSGPLGRPPDPEGATDPLGWGNDPPPPPDGRAAPRVACEGVPRGART